MVSTIEKLDGVKLPKTAQLGDSDPRVYRELVALGRLGWCALAVGTVSAQPTSPTPNEPLTVKYIGADDNYLVFEITVNTTGIQNSVLLIDDANVGELYTQKLFSNTKVEKIKIEKNDEG